MDTLKVESLESSLQTITYNAEQLIAMGKMWGVKPSLGILMQTTAFKKCIRAIDNNDKYRNYAHTRDSSRRKEGN